MAGTPKYMHPGGLPISDVLFETINKLVDDVELLRSKLAATNVMLDADAGVTSTTYNANNTPAAAALTAFKITNT